MQDTENNKNKSLKTTKYKKKEKEFNKSEIIKRDESKRPLPFFLSAKIKDSRSDATEERRKSSGEIDSFSFILFI